MAGEYSGRSAEQLHSEIVLFGDGAWSDEQIGRQLSLICIAMLLEARGEPPADQRAAVIESWRIEWSQSDEKVNAGEVALEAAFRAAAVGRLALAGARYRSVMLNSAYRAADMPRADANRREQVQRTNMQAEGAAKRRKKDYEQSRSQWQSVRDTEFPHRTKADAARLIAARFGLPGDAAIQTIRKSIK